MDIRKIREIARERVENAGYPAGKLALIYTGASVAVSFLLSLVGFILDRQMESHTGLGGLEMRSILSMAQSLLLIGGMIAMPFWNLGYTSAVLRTARKETAEPKVLLSGFSAFLPAVRLLLLQAAVVFGVCLLGMQAGSILYMLSPASDEAMIVLEQMLQNVTAIDEALAWDILELTWPMYVLIGIAILALFVPISYRLRLTEFSLMDGQEKALVNMANSYRLMRGKCFAFFRLDLGFWWYYALQLLATLLSYGDVFFPGNQLAYWGFYCLSGVAQLVIGWRYLPRVMTTYAVAYEEITKKEQV